MQTSSCILETRHCSIIHFVSSKISIIVAYIYDIIFQSLKIALTMLKNIELLHWPMLIVKFHVLLNLNPFTNIDVFFFAWLCWHHFKVTERSSIHDSLVIGTCLLLSCELCVILVIIEFTLEGVVLNNFRHNVWVTNLTIFLFYLVEFLFFVICRENIKLFLCI